MTVQLSPDLQNAVDSVGTPLKLVDPRTGKEYLLVDDSSHLPAGDELADTYRVQIESALRAGWDDPQMDEYNDYDRHRKE